tara:strand:+ start:373 stop:513 length:141 start_codon:yes stop_codon:yes gene_type:complete
MSQQSTSGFGVAHPVSYSPQKPEKKVEKKEEKFDEEINIEETLTTL